MYQTILTVLMILFFSACQASFMPRPSDPADKYPPIARQNYVEGTEDLPIFPGFTAIDADNTSYDTTEGRIIEMSYRGSPQNNPLVAQYYRETLPELGWKLQTDGLYERDGETLQVTIQPDPQYTILTFLIRPGRF